MRSVKSAAQHDPLCTAQQARPEPRRAVHVQTFAVSTDTSFVVRGTQGVAARSTGNRADGVRPCPYRKQFIARARRAKPAGPPCGAPNRTPARNRRAPNCRCFAAQAAACISSSGRRCSARRPPSLAFVRDTRPKCHRLDASASGKKFRE